MAASIDGILIDLFESENYVYDSDVAEDEVESGGVFTDSIKDKSDEIHLTCIVSDTPIGDMVRVRAEATSAGIDSELPFLPSDEAEQKLLAIRAAHKPVIVETSRGAFENMAMTSYNPVVDRDTGKTLSFTASFRRVRIYTNNRVTIKVAASQLSGKSKIKRPPVVIVDPTTRVPVAIPQSTVKLPDGTRAKWDSDQGQYVDAKGNPVADADLSPDSREFQSAVRGDNEANDTFFDTQTDEWKNTDGTPVTRSQIDKKSTPGFKSTDGTPPGDFDKEAWWARQQIE